MQDTGKRDAPPKQDERRSGVSLTPTGEKWGDCGSDKEEDIYTYDDDPPVPQRTITGHGKNSDGNTECKVEFKFYALRDSTATVIRTDTVGAQSTPSRTGRWVKVTAKCLKSPVEKGQCRYSWTVGP